MVDKILETFYFEMSFYWPEELSFINEISLPYELDAFKTPPMEERIVKKAMTNSGSRLFQEISGEFTARGVKPTLERIKQHYMDGFFNVLHIVNDEQEYPDGYTLLYQKIGIERKFLNHIIEEERGRPDSHLMEWLKVGDTFLQILADKAGEMGGDPSIIHSIMGKRPRGAGVLTTVGNNMQGCQTGFNDENEQDDELVCNQPQQEIKDDISVEKRKRGRPQKDFEKFFISKDYAEIVIPILKKFLKGKYGRDAVRIIVACCEGGWMTEPSASSIERAFGIEASGLKEPLRCHFNPKCTGYKDKPKFPPFTKEELSPIIEKIRQEINK